jgi:hypothetical protein
VAAIRALATILLCGAAVFAADTAFRGSLLTHVRPIILTPGVRAATTTPVQLRWEGPRDMRVLLYPSGAEPVDLGVQQSPFEIAAAAFPRDGGYRIDIRHPRFGTWIRARQWFHLTVPPPAEAPAEPPPTASGDAEIKELESVLEAERQTREAERLRRQALAQEARALRQESERLAEEVESLYEEQEEDSEYIARLETRIDQLTREQRSLSEESAALQLRLSRVIPCSVWGYYSYPRPQTIPVTRRLLRVSTNVGRIFRFAVECEAVRRGDETAASECFCVGNSFGE